MSNTESSRLKQIADVVTSIIAAPAVLGFMFAYGAWCRYSYNRALTRKAGS